MRSRVDVSPGGAIWEMERVLTLGPAGPPLQSGVLVVPQSAQVFFCSLLLLGLFPEEGALGFESSPSDPCTTTSINQTNPNQKPRNHYTIVNTHFSSWIHHSDHRDLRFDWFPRPPLFSAESEREKKHAEPAEEAEWVLESKCAEREREREREKERESNWNDDARNADTRAPAAADLILKQQSFINGMSKP